MLKKIKILIADKIDLSNIKMLPKSQFTVVVNFGISNSAILKSKVSYDGIIIRSTRIIDEAFLSKCNLRIIATCSKGVDHIDVNYARKKKIAVIICQEGNNISTAEHTMGLILTIFKKICYSDNLVRNGRFGFIDFNRRELDGKKIGVIGIGKVGSHVVKLSEAFGMEIFANDIDYEVRKKYTHLQFKSLNYILKHSDIITLHIPLDKRNYNFISKEKLDLINLDSILINTSRGKIIDEKHLIKLLRQKKIAFAGLDVFHNEPDINIDFFKLDNVILTNHIAGKTQESSIKIAKDVLEQVRNFFVKN